MARGGFFYIALKEARKSKHNYKLGALLLKKGRVIGRGFNQAKTHPKLHRDYNYPSRHAECNAIMSTVCQGDTLFVVRLTKSGKLSCSKPCERCKLFIRDSRIQRVFYTNWRGEIEQMSL